VPKGKTTLASEIACLLESLDMSVTVVDLESSIFREHHEKCVEAMAGREVLIETVPIFGGTDLKKE
jgi:hypothetical protein